MQAGKEGKREQKKECGRNTVASQLGPLAAKKGFRRVQTRTVRIARAVQRCVCFVDNPTRDVCEPLSGWLGWRSDGLGMGQETLVADALHARLLRLE